MPRLIDHGLRDGKKEQRRRMIEIMVDLQRFRKRGALHSKLLEKGLYACAFPIWKKEKKAYCVMKKSIEANLFSGDEQRGPGGLQELVGRKH